MFVLNSELYHVPKKKPKELYTDLPKVLFGFVVTMVLCYTYISYIQYIHEHIELPPRGGKPQKTLKL